MEQVAYYRALAPEYEQHAIAGHDELAAALEAFRPGGRVLELACGPGGWTEELIEGEASSTIERRLKDGTAFRAVKVPHRPAELERRLRALGWNIGVRATGGPFYWGSGARAA